MFFFTAHTTSHVYTLSLHDALPISFTEKINEINTDGVAPTTHGIQLTNVLRDDMPQKWDKREEALSNAPEQEDGQFKVPAIDRKSTRLNSSHVAISYAVFCLKKKKH